MQQRSCSRQRTAIAHTFPCLRHAAQASSTRVPQCQLRAAFVASHPFNHNAASPQSMLIRANREPTAAASAMRLEGGESGKIVGSAFGPGRRKGDARSVRSPDVFVSRTLTENPVPPGFPSGFRIEHRHVQDKHRVVITIARPEPGAPTAIST